MMYDVFISYCVSDGREYALAIKRIIENTFFLNCYFSENDSSIGPELDNQIRDTIDHTKTVIALVTQNALCSSWVKGEILYANSQKKDIIIYRFKGINHADIPIPLQSATTAEFYSINDLEEKILHDQRWGIPVIIPAAGQSSGITPFSLGMPKSLLPVCGKPILHHIFQSFDLHSNIISSLVVLAGQFFKELDYYSSLFRGKINIKCIPTPAQTLAGALLKMNLKTTFLIYFADILLEDNVDWSRMLWQHRQYTKEYSSMGTLLASRHYQLPVGRIIPASTGAGIIESFSEKPQMLLSDYPNMPIALFEPSFLQFLKPNDDSLFGQSLVRAMNGKNRFCFYSHSKWRHIQTLTDWLAAQKE